MSTALLVAALLNPARAAVVPPDQLFAGKTYSQWTAAFNQWELEVPWDGHHPLQDRTGAYALRNQSGPVWFLSLVTTSNLVTRNIRVPDDKALFVCIDRVECSTVESPPFYGGDEAELRACVESFRPAPPFCEIDGVPVPDLESFRFTSPLFDFNLPEPNAAGVPGGGPGQGVGRGTSVIVHALSLGSHIIHFRGGYPDYNVSWNVTYQITVFARPAITIRPLPGTNLMELSWPSTTGFSLQEAEDLSAIAIWSAASAVSTSLTNGIQTVTVTNAPTRRFFRLYQP